MKRIEYRTVRFGVGLTSRLSGDDFGDQFLRVLNEEGQQGWELREVIRESGLSSLLIFSREIG